MFRPDLARPSAELLDETQAQEFLGLSRTTLWRLRQAGALPFYRVGGRIRYSPTGLLDWLRDQRGPLAVREPTVEYVVTRAGRGRESAWKSAIEAQDWAFHDDDTDSLTHGIHPYPAKFPPQIPARLIELLTESGHVVLDPYCGSGTTLVEALRLDRAAIGVDVNPIAVLVSQAKTARLTDCAERALDELELAVDADAARERGQPVLFARSVPPAVPGAPPPIPNISRWFSATVVRELAVIRARLDALGDDVATRVAKATLSAILVTVSNQDSETRYKSRPKETPPGAVLAAFLRKLREMRKALLAFRDATPCREARILLADARSLPQGQVGPIDAVITSPPYANAFDYHLYHRHRLYWLGYEPRELRDREIGSHLNYQRKRDGIETYRQDMLESLVSIASLLRPGSPCALVVGDSVFGGDVVDNAALIADAGSEAGFRCETVVERHIHPTKRSMIHAARRARLEKIVLLVRDS